METIHSDSKLTYKKYQTIVFAQKIAANTLHKIRIITRKHLKELKKKKKGKGFQFGVEFSTVLK